MTTMTTMTPFDRDRSRGPGLPRSPHRSVGTTLVAALYVLLVVASPLLVRFAPVPGAMVAAATMEAGPVAETRCATAPEFGWSCGAATDAVRTHR